MEGTHRTTITIIMTIKTNSPPLFHDSRFAAFLLSVDMKRAVQIMVLTSWKMKYVRGDRLFLQKSTTSVMLRARQIIQNKSRRMFNLFDRHSLSQPGIPSGPNSELLGTYAD